MEIKEKSLQGNLLLQYIGLERKKKLLKRTNPYQVIIIFITHDMGCGNPKGWDTASEWLNTEGMNCSGLQSASV